MRSAVARLPHAATDPFLSAILQSRLTKRYPSLFDSSAEHATSAASATPSRRSSSPSTECTRCFPIPTGLAARTSRSDRLATVGCASSSSGSARRPSGPPSAPHVPANSCSATTRASCRSCVSPASPHLEPLGESQGRATMLPGDAAYPTTPSLGQGACHAMGAAGVFARCLAEGRHRPPLSRRFGYGAICIRGSPFNPTVARNTTLVVVPTCVGPLEGGRTHARRREFTRWRTGESRRRLGVTTLDSG
jgi:hypothetical protein